MNSGLRRWQAWRREIAAAAQRSDALRSQPGRPAISDELKRSNKAAGVAKRRAAKLRRTPPWADHRAIRRVYEEARRLTNETGIPHHVDHVTPLCGRAVSGLHVETNLQIIPGSENCRKHNRFEVEV